jgi:glycosyltransferase involved in cell wall biosynthesis
VNAGGNMKKALFVSDHKFKKHNNQIYTTGALNENLFKRYLTYFNQLLVTGRCSVADNEADINGLSLADCDNVEFNFLEQNNILYASLFERKKTAIRLRECISKCDCAIVRLPSVLGLMAISVLKKAKKPYIVEMVGCAWDSLRTHSRKGKIFAPLMWLLTRKTIRDAPYVVYVTEKFLQKRYPCNGNTINISNVELKNVDDEVLNARLNFIRKRNEKNLIIGTIANVSVKYKGQQYVIEALGRLKKQGHINFKYQLVGGGKQSYLKTIVLKHDVADQVEFLGHLPHNKVFDWLDSIDIYCQPSLAEGLPRALIEAMSRGGPSIGSCAGGISELFIDNDYIFKRSKSGVDEIANLLLRFQSPQARQEQALRNFNTAKNYTKDVLYARRSKFFEMFINRCAKGV